MVGRTLRHYRIEQPLGAGGMGEVYVAEDLKLHRKVALKTIAAQLVADPDALTRLQREAQAIATLNHPGIVTIYSVEEAEGIHYLTMELVDGQPLSQAIPRDGLTVPQALDIAIQIADALDAAHGRGIVHRDVKPGNVMLVRSATTRVKVLDFGLAKLAHPAAVAGQTGTITVSGLIVGTPQYMSPEQMEGHAVDHRADIFAFGVLLYEMLTGRHAFEGSSAAGVMAAVLTREPPAVSELRPGVPAILDVIVAKCLRKDPEARWQSARDLCDALRWTRDGVSVASASGKPHRTATRRPWLIASAALLVGVGLTAAAAVFMIRERTAEPPAWARAPIRFTLTAASPPRDLALSSDGRQLAYVATGPSGSTAIWVRALDQSEARIIPHTTGATNPFWSPDGRSLGFHANDALKRIDVAAGAAPQTLWEVPVGMAGGAWGSAGVIVFSLRQVMYQIPATGGTATAVTALDLSRQENAHRFPHFLPDGRRFLYVARSGRPEKSGIYLASLDGDPPARLFSALSAARFAPPTSILFVKDDVLLAQSFDVDSRRATGTTQPVATLAGADPWTTAAAFSVSEAALAYRAPDRRSSQLTWFDRTGRVIGTLGEPEHYAYFRLAPDGRHVAVDIAAHRVGMRSIWIFDVATGARSRFTFTGTHDFIPVWSPDGSRLLFSSFRDGPANLYQKLTSGAAEPQPVLVSSDQKFAHDWSPDGRFVAYMQTNAAQDFDVMVRRVDGSEKAIPIGRSDAIEFYPRFSPDGRWIAYGSAESGTREIYVQPFPPTGGKWQVSSGGAHHVRWSADGRELFYMTARNEIVALDVKATAAAFGVGAPRQLFQVENAASSSGSNTFEVAPDGRRFLINVMQPASTDTSVTVVLNWAANLPR